MKFTAETQRRGEMRNANASADFADLHRLNAKIRTRAFADDLLSGLLGCIGSISHFLILICANLRNLWTRFSLRSTPRLDSTELVAGCVSAVNPLSPSFVRASICIVCGALLATISRPAIAADNEAFDVTLSVLEAANVDRTHDPVSMGVPFPVGMLPDTDGIAVYDPAGKPVPAQFRVLEIWREYGAPQTIKWLLVTFLADVPAAQRSDYHLKPGKNPAPSEPAKPVEGLAPLQLVLTNPDGEEIDDSKLSISREVVETGPVRSCVKFEAPSSHKTFGFIAWVYTYAGLPRTDATIVLKNTPNEPQGPMYFEDFSVVVAPPEMTKTREFCIGAEPGNTAIGELLDGEEVHLYQDSDGTDRWQRLGTVRDFTSAFVLDNTKERALASQGLPEFRGYRVSTGKTQIGQGDFALGWSALFDKRQMATLSMRHFFYNYPAAAEVQPGKLIARLLPKYWQGHGGLHWLDDAQRKRYDVSFQMTDDPSASRGDQIALAFDMPLVAYAGRDWYEKTRAAGHLAESQGATTGGDFKFDPGWVTFGGDTPDRIRRRYHEQTMRPFLETGDPWRAYHLMVGAEHSSAMTPIYLDDYQYPRDRDVFSVKQYCTVARPAGQYRAYTGHHGFKPWNMAHFTCQELFDAWRLFGDPLALEAIQDITVYQQFYADHRKAGGGAVAGTRSDGLPLKNMCEAYRITGDPQILKSLETLVSVAWRQVNKARGNYGVMPTWEKGKEPVEKPFMMSQVMDGLREYYDLTHDEGTADLLLGMTDFILRESYCGSAGFTYVVKLGDADAQRRFREDEIKTYASKKGSFRGYLNSEHLAFAYCNTGESRYRDAIMKLVLGYSEGGEKTKGQMSRTLDEIDGRDEHATPPKAVTNLKAERLEGNRVQLTWTTPADAARLQIKWSPRPITENAWPDQQETHTSWWSAEQVTGEPPPQPGMTQSMVVELRPANSYYFALRSFDGRSNRSEISNVVQVP